MTVRRNIDIMPKLFEETVFMGQNILVTGGLGFIGSNFICHLMDKCPEYDNIYVLDILTYAGNIDNVPESIRKNPKYHFIHGSICNARLLDKLLPSIDVIVNFAAESFVTLSLTRMDVFVDTNVKGVQILCESALKHSVSKFVHISSSEVYGSARTAPMTEDHPLLPANPYAGTKAAGERLAYSYYETYGLPLIIVRPFNNYGPKQHLEKVIPYFTLLAQENKPITIHGTGNQTRDWLHVSDLCNGIVSILKADVKNMLGEAFNFGTGEDTSIKDIALACLKMLGRKENMLQFINERPGQVDRHIAGFEKSRKMLKWEPAVSFKNGLPQTIDWYLKNQEWIENVKTRWVIEGWQEQA